MDQRKVKTPVVVLRWELTTPVENRCNLSLLLSLKGKFPVCFSHLCTEQLRYAIQDAISDFVDRYLGDHEIRDYSGWKTEGSSSSPSDQEVPE